MREYKYVCKDCKEHLTNSEDRLCEWCQDKKGLILHRFALSVEKDVLLHGMVCYNCRPKVLRSPINLACLGREALEWVELEYVIFAGSL